MSTPRLRVGGRSDVGMQRADNQDSMYAGPWLAAVADGVGGAAGGEVASRLTITALMKLDTDDIGDPRAALQTAADDADASIRQTVGSNPSLSGMGTTLTAILATGGHVALAHIGDSRAYRLRQGRLEQLTSDHTLVQALIDEGQITEEEALTHPRRSWILRALDGRGNPEVDITMLEIESGDRYLVCSDGLSSYVSESDITDGLIGDDPQLAADRLVQLALRAGGSDNITCIVADPGDGLVQQAPILGGAVAEDSPAELATSIAPPPQDLPPEDVPPEVHPDEARRSIGRRLAAVAGLIVILVAAGVGGVAVYIHRQWYVAPVNGNVAIFQGVQGRAAGIHLQQRRTVTNIPVTALPQDDRERVANGIQASGGKSGASSVVANLRNEACDAGTAAPTPGGGTTETPSPTPTATAPPRHHGTRHGKNRHVPQPPTTLTPLPIVTPVWCATSS